MANQHEPGTVQFKTPRPGVIESVYSGHMTAAVLDQNLKAFRDKLSAGSTTHWVANALGVTRFDPTVSTIGAAWLREFKSQGGKQVILISGNSAIRMIAATAGFVAGVPIKAVETREAAAAHLPK